MTRTSYRRIGLAGVVVVAVLVALKVVLANMPIQLEGEEWLSVETCAENQKWLYQSIEHYVEEHGEVPPEDFPIRGWEAKDTWKCPACGVGYVLQLDNYGNPEAAVIVDRQHKHPTTLMWRLRGLNPRVTTMGDGTIRLFQDGKVLTMNGSKGDRTKRTLAAAPQ